MTFDATLPASFIFDDTKALDSQIDVDIVAITVVIAILGPMFLMTSNIQNYLFFFDLM